MANTNQPYVSFFSGLAKSTETPPTAAGFSDQLAGDRDAITGTITYPAGAVLQNGVAVGTKVGGGSSVTLSALTPGELNGAVTLTKNGSLDSTGFATIVSGWEFLFLPT